MYIGYIGIMEKKMETSTGMRAQLRCCCQGTPGSRDLDDFRV